MSNFIPSIASSVVMAVVVVWAMIIDVRSRRIPNYITFPAMAVGAALWLVHSSWFGLLLGLTGAFLAPFTLLLLRGFRPLGMGDIKLAAAVGALTGPAVGPLAMLVSSVTGGVLALLLLLRPGSSAAASLGPLVIGIPFLGRIYGSASPKPTTGATTLPYGLAIGVGSILTLTYFQWTL